MKTKKELDLNKKVVFKNKCLPTFNIKYEFNTYNYIFD